MNDREKYLKSFVKVPYPLEELFTINPEQEVLIRGALQMRHQEAHQWCRLERDSYKARSPKIEQLLFNLYPVYYYHGIIGSMRSRERYIEEELKKALPLSHEEVKKCFYQHETKYLSEPYDDFAWSSFCSLLTDTSDLGISMFLDKIAEMLIEDKQYLTEHNIKGIGLEYDKDKNKINPFKGVE